jgi:ABC-2 type transport system permease protein
MNSLRVLVIGGRLSYRALFTWLPPAIYIPTILGGTVFQILFFAYLGRATGVKDDSFFVVGNAIQACSMAAVYGATRTVAYERNFGTLASILASPANRAALFLGRSLPLVAHGIFVAFFGLAVGRLLLAFHPAPSSFAPLLVILFVAVCANTAFGMALGAIGLRARDVFFTGNMAYFLSLLVCGVNVPFATLPPALQLVGRALPLTHGIAAARVVAAGGSFQRVEGLVITELVVGVVWGCIALVLFRFFELEARRHATLETV